jgi:hypothetical protein
MTETVSVPVGTISDWTDIQWTNFKWWLEKLLRDETIEVVFTKTDGSERVMRCTMNSTILTSGIKLLEEKRAIELQDKGDGIPTKPKRPKPKDRPENITVWDIEAEDWRSFKLRSLTNILTLIIKYDYREPNFGEFESLV